jgi:hypothetical protein
LTAVLGATIWRQVRQKRLNRALIAAVKRTDDQAVVSLLNLGADANCRVDPPHRSAWWEELLQWVRDRRLRASHAPTPLLIALHSRRHAGPFSYPPENIALIGALLDHGAQVNLSDESDASPLYWALVGSKNATARLLLAHGASVQPGGYDVKFEGKTGPSFVPLLEAVSNPKIECSVIVDLLDHGAEVSQRDVDGQTPLGSAIVFQRVDVVRLLLNRHADVTELDNGETPLAIARDGNSPQSQHTQQIVRLLRAAGAKE